MLSVCRLALALLLLSASVGEVSAQALQAPLNLRDVPNKPLALQNMGATSPGGIPVRRGFSLPFSGVPTTADPDVYQIPAGITTVVPASTVPAAICRVNPAATVTFLVKKWTGTSSASSSTLCTGSLSTSCVVSGCTISSTTFSAGNGISIEATEASADTAARLTITVPWDWQ